MHDLIIVAVLDPDFAKARSRDDGEVSFDRHLGWIDADLVQHCRDANPTGHSPALAINPNSKASVDAHRGANRSRAWPRQVCSGWTDEPSSDRAQRREGRRDLEWLKRRNPPARATIVAACGLTRRWCASPPSCSPPMP